MSILIFANSRPQAMLTGQQLGLQTNQWQAFYPGGDIHMIHGLSDGVAILCDGWSRLRSTEEVYTIRQLLRAYRFTVYIELPGTGGALEGEL